MAEQFTRQVQMRTLTCTHVHCAAAYNHNGQVLDAEDADQLLGIMAGQLASWDCSQLAAALIHCLPCLGEVAPSGGDSLALLFAAAGAAAAGMTGQQAGQVLVVLAQLPGYAPEPKVGEASLPWLCGWFCYCAQSGNKTGR